MGIYSSGCICDSILHKAGKLIKQRISWPSVVQDAWRFVSACPICTVGKGSNRPPVGLLQTFSVPLRPWPHIAMDFVTYLPRDGYRLYFIDTDNRYRYLSILLLILFGVKRYDVKCCWTFQAILLLLNFSKCIKVLQSGEVSCFSCGVLFY